MKNRVYTELFDENINYMHYWNSKRTRKIASTVKHGIVPFIIEDKIKMFYYRGLKECAQEKGCLMAPCLSAQDTFKSYLDYFRIAHDK